MSSKKKRGLGKGLNALLGPQSSAQQPPEARADDTAERIHQISIDQLQRGRYQPRADFDDEALAELSDSIRRQGVLQPIVVRKVENGHEIVAGERRWRASKLAGLQQMPCIVRDINDHQAAAIGLIENLQRANLNPIEECAALGRLQSEFELTHMEIAEVVGRSRAAVSNLLRLAELEPEVSAMVTARQIEMGHARALLALKGAQQINGARSIHEKGLNVRQAESMVRALMNPSTKAGPENAPSFEAQAAQLSQSLGQPISIKSNAKGSGKIEIRFSQAAELEKLIEQLSRIDPERR